MGIRKQVRKKVYEQQKTRKEDAAQDEVMNDGIKIQFLT